MPSSIANQFYKGAACPASQALLAYHQARLLAAQMERIESHLASCDFCNAELQLLARFDNSLEEYSFSEMPAQLRRLAESLLGARHAA